MLIKDIISEAPTKKGPGQSYGAFRAMDPETYATVVNVQNWKRELEQNKAERQKELQKEVERPDKLRINSININTDAIEEFEKTKDKNLAYEIGKKWHTRSLPEKIVNEIINDSEWKNIILSIFNFAVKKNKIPKLIPYKNIPQGKYYEVQKENGKNLKILHKFAPIGMELERRLQLIIDKYLEKYNIDRTGRQLPPKKLT